MSIDRPSDHSADISGILYDFIRPVLSGDQKAFFNKAALLGSFWTEYDIVPLSSAMDREKEKSSSQNTDHFPRPIAKDQISLKDDSLFSMCHAALCPKCKKPLLSEFAAHIESCTASLSQPAIINTKGELSPVKPSAFPIVKTTEIMAGMSSITAPPNGLNPGKLSSTPSSTVGAVAPSKSKRKAPVVLDLDRHCGVLTEDGVHCVRALTCKSHSMSSKRAVIGRSMEFDKLLARHHSQKSALSTKGISGTIAKVPITYDHSLGGVISSDPSVSLVTGSKESKGVFLGQDLNELSTGNGNFRSNLLGSVISSHPTKKRAISIHKGTPIAPGSVPNADATGQGIAHAALPTDPIFGLLEDGYLFSDISRLSKVIKDFYNRHHIGNFDAVELPLGDSLEALYYGPLSDLIDKSLVSSDYFSTQQIGSASASSGFSVSGNLSHSHMLVTPQTMGQQVQHMPNFSPRLESGSAKRYPSSYGNMKNGVNPGSASQNMPTLSMPSSINRK